MEDKNSLDNEVEQLHEEINNAKKKAEEIEKQKEEIIDEHAKESLFRSSSANQNLKLTTLTRN